MTYITALSPIKSPIPLDIGLQAVFYSPHGPISLGYRRLLYLEERNAQYLLVSPTNKLYLRQYNKQHVSTSDLDIGDSPPHQIILVLLFHKISTSIAE